MTLQVFIALLSTVVTNGVLIGSLAWSLSARLTRIEGRIRALEIVFGIEQDNAA